jgi:hypothetical protein
VDEAVDNVREYKGVQVVPSVGQTAGLLICKVKKGRLPDMLTGMFTSYRKACDMIDTWERKKRPSISKPSEVNAKD